MKKVETYMLEEFDMIPTLEDITECIHIANTNNCIIRLEWNTRRYGSYNRLIYASDDPQDVYDKQIPHNDGLE